MDAALTVKGQVTIPKPLRQLLGLRPGDRVKFFVQEDGRVVLLPKQPATALRGIVKSPRHSVTLEAMDDGVAAGAAAGSQE